MIRRVLIAFTKSMPALVALCGVLAYLAPEPFRALRPHLQWIFAATMLGIGTVMESSDFRPIVTRPMSVVLGLSAQFAIMPALGFAIGKLLGFEARLLAGMVLVGAVPGAMASNVISYLARTDVAYSIALTSSATLLAPVVTPSLTLAYAATSVPIPFWNMVESILIMVVAPLLFGFLLKRRFRVQIERISFVFPALSALAIILICATVVALNSDKIAGLTKWIFAGVFFHNALGYLFGYGAGRLFQFEPRRRKTLAIEVGMQNAGLGAVLALDHFDAETALIPALFATWCVMTASALAQYWRWKDGQAEGNEVARGAAAIR